MVKASLKTTPGRQFKNSFSNRTSIMKRAIIQPKFTIFGQSKAAKDSLLKQDDMIVPPEYEMMSTGNNLLDSSNNLFASSTNLFGAGKANFVETTFGSAAANQLESYHKYMNYEDTSYV